MSLNGCAVSISADNPPKPNTLSIWRRRIHLGTTSIPVGCFPLNLRERIMDKKEINALLELPLPELISIADKIKLVARRRCI